MKLSSIEQRFVLHWGEMGTKWGINRSVAQIHACLYLSPRPLSAEELADALTIARSNVSNSLHELQGWGIVRMVHVMGDRRAHFESMTDVWEMFRIIVEARKQREFDPTLAALRELKLEMDSDKKPDTHTQERIGEMLAFMETMAAGYAQVQRLPRTSLERLLKMSAKLRKALGIES